MVNTSGPNGPGGPNNQLLPMWGWIALVVVAIVVFGLIFTWTDSTQQQAEFQPNQPPATSTTPPPSSPNTPPAQSPTTPAPKQQ